jgi:transcriptional regulator with XRE-family HTH domain
MNLEIANKLLALRKKNNLSQEELAEKLGVSRQAISKWERGETSPDTDNLILLANLYRVSLDELLGIDVKTFKSDYVPPFVEDGGMSRKTIRLTKSDDYENSKRVVYPKDSLDEEIYPQAKPQELETPTADVPFTGDAYNVDVDEEINQMSQMYQQSNPIVAVPPKSRKGFKNRFKGFKGFKRRPKKNFRAKPNAFTDWFERMMKRFKVSYKGLYSFPIYAICIALAVLVSNIDLSYNDLFYNSDYISGIFVLCIPLYYTFIKAIQKRNFNYFAYPILALIFILLGYGVGFGDVSVLWLATIPFYYWFLNKDND